jgi:hypothetical protein
MQVRAEAVSGAADVTDERATRDDAAARRGPEPRLVGVAVE